MQNPQCLLCLVLRNLQEFFSLYKSRKERLISLCSTKILILRLLYLTKTIQNGYCKKSLCLCVCVFKGAFFVLPLDQLQCQIRFRAVVMLAAPNSELCQISRDICLNSDVRQILRHNIWSLLVLNIYPSLGAVDVEDTF